MFQLSWQRLEEFILSLSGYRKLGALDAVDKRDYVLGELPILRKDKDLSEIDNRSWHRTSQGNTSKCVLFTVARVAMGVVSLYHKKKVTFNPDELGALMGDLYQEGRGAYLRDGFKTIIKHGLHDERGNLWKFEKFVKIPPAQFDEAIEKGFPIGTGSFTKSPMCDRLWNWITATLKDARGHAWVIFGRMSNIRKDDNSWGKWGKRRHGKPTGTFYHSPEQDKYLFTAFTLINPTME